MKIKLDQATVEQIETFCRRWKVLELALFGSVLRDDYGPESDVDIMVTFFPDADWGLLDHVQMKLELSTIFKKEVDLVTHRGLSSSRNWLRRDEILKTAQVIYAGDGIDYAPG